jgi:hypothetical protein
MYALMQAVSCLAWSRVRMQACTFYCCLVLITLFPISAAMLAQSYAIDGARVMVGKPISENFQVQHNISMGPKDNRYNFGVTYVGGPQFGSSEVCLVADCTPA